MSEIHENKIKAKIGRVKAGAIADNYFPLIGHQVKIEANTKWAQSCKWETQSGDGSTIRSDGTLVRQSANTSFEVTHKGELTQRFIASNSLSNTEVQKTIYAMEPAIHPYFGVSVSKEIVRTDGEVSQIMIIYEQGYNGTNTMQVRVYRADNEVEPIFTTSTMIDITGGKACDVSFTERGQYDIEVDVTDTATGVMFTKRINKLITVTPRLAPEPADRSKGYRDVLAVKAYTTYSDTQKIAFNFRIWENTGEGLHYAELPLPAGEQNGTSWYESIDISILPTGTTLVLTSDPLEPDQNYPRRVLLKGNNPTHVSNASGTPNNSFEKPLIITHNQATTYHIPFQYYGGWNFDSNIRHLVIDGRGYHNLKNGFNVHKCSPDVFGETGIFFTNGTSNIEIMEVEFSDCDFTAMMAKTDPSADRPWFWFGNWALENLWLHHCYLHDTHGEGFYFGYFSPETLTGTNSEGKSVTYRAHSLENTLVYRNKFENNGFDAIQISNARNAQICYNDIYNSACRGEKDQCSGISIQGISGKCYNNVVRKFNGPGIQANPLGDLEIFNNIVSGCTQGAPGIQFLFSRTIPEQNPDGSNENDTLKIYVHNNIIEGNSMGVNGRNTTQVKGLYFTDNIIIYRTSLFANMTPETIAVWQSRASGNLCLKQSVPDFVAIDSHKIADSANGNWQTAHNSPLIKDGSGERFKFDFRGYKSWYGTMAPVGAFMGMYKDFSIVDDPIVLTGVAINEGEATTTGQVVSVKLTYTGTVTRCRLCEVSDFSTSPGWINVPSSGIVEYTLTEDYGQKVVYVQVSGGAITSNTMSDSIEFIGMPLVLNSVILNNGIATSRHLVVPVSFTFSGSFPPTHYRAGEVSDLSAATWLPMSSEMSYTFTSVGAKSLFAQLKDAEGTITEVKTGTITISDLAPIVTVSLGWGVTEIETVTPGLSIFDSTTGITRFLSGHNTTSPRTIYNNYGEVFGTAKPDTVGIHMFTNPATKGAITGNNSGIYPDTYLEHVSVWAGNSAGNTGITFTVAAGTYNVSLLCNTAAKAGIPNDALTYKLITATDNIAVVLPEAGVYSNTSTMTTPTTVTVGNDGLLRVEFGLSGITTFYWFAPLNIIKIEEL